MTVKNKADLKTDIDDDIKAGVIGGIEAGTDNARRTDFIDSALNVAEPSEQPISGPVKFNGPVEFAGGVAGITARHQTLLFAEDFTTQNPAGLNSTTQITFGPAQGSGGDPVMLDAAGTTTINQDLESAILVIIVAFGRTGGGGTSQLYFRNVVGGFPTSPQFEKLDNQNTQTTTFVSAPLNLPAGTTLSTEMVRDPSGHDSGGLMTDTPTATGWASPAPSAVFTVSGIVIE